MLRDPGKQVVLAEVVIASGLVAIGVIAGQGPMQDAVTATAATTLAVPLVSAARDVGLDWIASLAERGAGYFGKLWLGRRGAQNQHLATALGDALDRVVAQIDEAWRQTPRYLYLKRTDSEAAGQTVEALRWLREHAASLFQQPAASLASALGTNEIAVILEQDEGVARAMLTDALGQYLYGYDQEFVEFVQGYR